MRRESCQDVEEEEGGAGFWSTVPLKVEFHIMLQSSFSLTPVVAVDQFRSRTGQF